MPHVSQRKLWLGLRLTVCQHLLMHDNFRNSFPHNFTELSSPFFLTIAIPTWQMRKLELNKVTMSSRLVSGSHLWEVA